MLSSSVFVWCHRVSCDRGLLRAPVSAMLSGIEQPCLARPACPLRAMASAGACCTHLAGDAWACLACSACSRCATRGTCAAGVFSSPKSFPRYAFHRWNDGWLPASRPSRWRSFAVIVLPPRLGQSLLISSFRLFVIAPTVRRHRQLFRRGLGLIAPFREARHFLRPAARVSR